MGLVHVHPGKASRGLTSLGIAWTTVRELGVHAQASPWLLGPNPWVYIGGLGCSGLCPNVVREDYRPQAVLGLVCWPHVTGALTQYEILPYLVRRFASAQVALSNLSVYRCRWAIEYEGPAAEAFRMNHPGATVYHANCNVILAAAMRKAGQRDQCQACPEVRACISYLVETSQATVASVKCLDLKEQRQAEPLERSDGHSACGEKADPAPLSMHHAGEKLLVEAQQVYGVSRLSYDQ